MGINWFLIVKEERRLKEFENRVLRRIFGHKMDEMVCDWIKLHTKELYTLYSPSDLIRIIK
jgi:hypothetical protein